jgi:hypothetical protein
MSSVQAKLRQLQKASEFKTDSDYDDYLAAIEFLRDHQSPEVLTGMLQCLTDVEAGELQYELVEACEAYPDEPEYLRILGKNAAKLRRRSPQWGRMLVQSALNTPSCCKALYQLASERGAALEDLWKWIGAIAKEEPKYKSIVTEINKRLKKAKYQERCSRRATRVSTRRALMVET